MFDLVDYTWTHPTINEKVCFFALVDYEYLGLVYIASCGRSWLLQLHFQEKESGHDD